VLRVIYVFDSSEDFYDKVSDRYDGATSSEYVFPRFTSSHSVELRGDEQEFGRKKKSKDAHVAPDGSFGHLLCVVNAKDGVIMMGVEKTGTQVKKGRAH